MAKSSRILLPPSPGGQKSNIKASAGLVPSGGTRDESAGCLSPGFWRQLAIPRHSGLHLHMAFSVVCVTSSSVSYKDPLIQSDLILRSVINLHRRIFQIRSHSRVHIFWGEHLQTHHILKVV